MATINILVGDKITLSAIPTKNSIDADLVGIPTWVAAAPAVVHLEPADDGLTCVVTGKSAGSSLVTCNAQGASPLSANHTVAVAANNLATALSLSVKSPPI